MNESRAIVAASRCSEYRLEALRPALASLLEHLGDAEILGRSGEVVCVKPNLLKATPPEAAVCTHPAVVEVVLERIHDAGARAIIADSPAYGTVEQVADRTGISRVARRFGAEIRRFDDPRMVRGSDLSVYRELVVDGLVIDADRVVNLPKLKTHRQLTYTGAVKNLFGCVPGRRKAWWHVKAGAYEDFFARMLVDTCSLIAPAVTVMDGVMAMEGEGPGRGTPRPLGLLLAARDPVALDRVAIEIAGIDPVRVPTLVAARGMDVGQSDLERIDLVGAELADLIACPPFLLPRLRPIGFSLPRLVRGSLKQAWLERRSDGDTVAADATQGGESAWR